MSSPTADGGLIAGMEADVARRARRYAEWRRHSREIHLYRLLLPAVIAAIVLGLLGWVAYNTVAWRFVEDDSQRVSIRMVNPKFYGRTGDNSPYLISARSAARDDRDFQRVVLDHPVFVQDLNLPTETRIRARAGVYREDTRVLRLEKDLVLVDKRGYEFATDRAVIDTRSGTVQGQSPIAGKGPLGQIASSSYAVVNGGERIFFRGKVRSRIEQSRRAR